MKRCMVALFLVFATGLAADVKAQVPSAAGPDRPPPPIPRVSSRPVEASPNYSDLYAPGGRSVLRRTMPYGDESSGWGYRNPGNVGRVAEYYPPNNQFQNENATTRVAQFDQGPAATQRSAQMQGESLGIQRYNALQSHIDRYGSPARFGFGFGFGGMGFPY